MLILVKNMRYNEYLLGRDHVKGMIWQFLLQTKQLQTSEANQSRLNTIKLKEDQARRTIKKAIPFLSPLSPIMTNYQELNYVHPSEQYYFH